MPTICQPSAAGCYIAVDLHRRRFAAICGDKIKIECCLLARRTQIEFGINIGKLHKFSGLARIADGKIALIDDKIDAAYRQFVFFFFFAFRNRFVLCAASSACNFARSTLMTGSSITV